MLKNLCLLMIVLFSPCFAAEKEGTRSNRVIVSIAPYKYFAEKIAGDSVKVDVMVPTGASPHFYEPTTKQILNTGRADIWFRIGEAFETRAIQALSSYHPEMAVVDLREGIEMIAEEEGSHVHCSHHDCHDPHIWMSPRLAKQQAAIMEKALSLKYPEHKQEYQTKLRQFQQELDNLDQELGRLLAPLKNRTIVVSHPAYAYLCRDYDFKQLSIEFEGKDPTPRQLTHLISQVRALNTKVIFIQEQHQSKGAKLIAEQIGAKLVKLDPYAEDYKNNLLRIAKSFADH